MGLRAYTMECLPAKAIGVCKRAGREPPPPPPPPHPTPGHSRSASHTRTRHAPTPLPAQPPLLLAGLHPTRHGGQAEQVSAAHRHTGTPGAHAAAMHPAPSAPPPSLTCRCIPQVLLQVVGLPQDALQQGLERHNVALWHHLLRLRQQLLRPVHVAQRMGQAQFSSLTLCVVSWAGENRATRHIQQGSCEPFIERTTPAPRQPIPRAIPE